MREVFVAVCFLVLGSFLVGCQGNSSQSSGGSYDSATGGTVGYQAPNAMAQQIKMQEAMSRVTRSLTPRI